MALLSGLWYQKSVQWKGSGEGSKIVLDSVALKIAVQVSHSVKIVESLVSHLRSANL